MTDRESRAFVYFRHTRRTLTFIASHDLSPMGVGKTPIKYSDKRCDAMMAVMDAMVTAGKAARTGSRPDKAMLAAFVKATLIGQYDITDVIHLPRQGNFGERIMIKFGGTP